MSCLLRVAVRLERVLEAHGKGGVIRTRIARGTRAGTDAVSDVVIVGDVGRNELQLRLLGQVVEVTHGIHAGLAVVLAVATQLELGRYADFATDVATRQVELGSEPHVRHFRRVGNATGSFVFDLLVTSDQTQIPKAPTAADLPGPRLVVGTAERVRDIPVDFDRAVQEEGRGFRLPLDAG